MISREKERGGGGGVRKEIMISRERKKEGG